ncbi:2-hydroxycarboxylate transporter family protein [Bacillus spizizenii]|nr:2-hydroxycarboxylate transporter family protein [Bacillus spizizenii]QCJ17939.1 hypothetical protein FA024_12660 [Bacillus subtilis]MBE0172502.1 hypothetical protein [Bacillus spizizenii]MBT3127657.1 2-hydroxycarboxylate transporter family protein [Bacillus spizizenii]MDR4202191.1 hypothetical protein [Bacillus spizizenii ATCC 6633 = JCM 2499]QCY18183.1 hypothetical protein EO946_14180 [Bacillus spizizenii ATCC 6633 = JCM 2499]
MIAVGFVTGKWLNMYPTKLRLSMPAIQVRAERGTSSILSAAEGLKLIAFAQLSTRRRSDNR